MTIYIVTFLILLALVPLDTILSGQGKKIGLRISYLVLLVVVGLRFETGTDWWAYETHYYMTASGAYLFYDFDIGYQALVGAATAIGLNYQVFLFIITAIYLSAFYWSFSRFPYSNLIAFLYYAIHVIGLMGTTRQMMALGLCAVALAKLIERKNAHFFVFVILAALFHKSAIFFLLVYPISIFSQRYDPRKSVWIFAIIGVVGLASIRVSDFLLALLQPFGNIANRVTEYIVSDTQTVIYYVDDPMTIFLLYAKRIAYAMVFYFLLNYNKDKDAVSKIFYVYLFGLVSFIALYSIAPAVAIRLSLYYTIFEIYLFSYAAHATRFKFVFLACVAFVAIEGLVSSLTYDEDLIIPYKGAWINSDYYRQAR